MTRLLKRLLKGWGDASDQASQGAPQRPYSQLQHYPGYTNTDVALLERYAACDPQLYNDRFTDGFGVETLHDCVPFVDPQTLDARRLKLPVPDDGFHAEAIEYVALLDAFEHRRDQQRFHVAELGAGWGPWLALAGVVARRHGVQQLVLSGVEASPARFALLQQHLSHNQLLGVPWVNSHLFEGAVWTHNGNVFFPDVATADMGAAATTEQAVTDYRGQAVTHSAVPCLTLPSLLGDGGCDFLHVDLQGAEQTLLAANLEYLSQSVSSLLVATHSREIEGQLITLLATAGWQLLREKPCQFRLPLSDTSAIGLTTCDGSQYWHNKKLTQKR